MSGSEWTLPQAVGKGLHLWGCPGDSAPESGPHGHFPTPSPPHTHAHTHTPYTHIHRKDTLPLYGAEQVQARDTPRTPPDLRYPFGPELAARAQIRVHPGLPRTLHLLLPLHQPPERKRATFPGKFCPKLFIISFNFHNPLG